MMEKRRSEVKNALQDALAVMNIALDETAVEKLLDYDALLLEGNAVMNLTALTEPKDVAEKHFADSLLPLCFDVIPPNAEVIDVGTGAGFPGLVLGIARPDIRLTLLDATRKRVNFLLDCCEELGVTAECIHARAEDAARFPDLRDGFDVAVSRAVASAAELCELTLPFVRSGGRSLCYKGGAGREEFAAASRALQSLKGNVDRIEEIRLPWGERSLICIKKTASTPRAYPRKPGIPHGQPL
jgi:16S rRNA (guanine(527)-N(7))-methyltransferase GidB